MCLHVACPFSDSTVLPVQALERDEKDYETEVFYVAGYDPPFRITGARHGQHARWERHARVIASFRFNILLSSQFLQPSPSRAATLVLRSITLAGRHNEVWLEAKDDKLSKQQ